MRMMVIPLQSSVKLIATLKSTDGVPLSNKPIYFYASSDRNTWTLITTVNTDGTGTATCTSSIYSWYKAEFKGDDQYDPSSIEAQYSASTSPTPTPAPTCCSFSDFSCWFFKQGKCVNISNTTVDSTMLSIAMVAAALLLLIILLK